MDVERSVDVALEQQAAVGRFRVAEALLHILARVDLCVALLHLQTLVQGSERVGWHLRHRWRKSIVNTRWTLYSARLMVRLWWQTRRCAAESLLPKRLRLCGRDCFFSLSGFPATASVA
jgi:hypothetical protein